MLKLLIWANMFLEQSEIQIWSCMDLMLQDHMGLEHMVQDHMVFDSKVQDCIYCIMLEKMQGTLPLNGRWKKIQYPAPRWSTHRLRPKSLENQSISAISRNMGWSRYELIQLWSLLLKAKLCKFSPFCGCIYHSVPLFLQIRILCPTFLHILHPPQKECTSLKFVLF